MRGYIESLLNQYEAAINYKQNIHAESYYYNELVLIKCARRTLGVKGDPYYKENWEKRFNAAAYNQAISDANCAISRVKHEIVTVLNNLNNAVNVSRDEITSYSSRYNESLSKNNQLNYSIAQENQNSSLLNSQNSQLQAEFSNKRSIVHQTDNAAKIKNQNNITDKNSNLALIEEIKKQQIQNYNIFKSIDLKQRAFLISELIVNNKEENVWAIDQIKFLGFDANALAYYAVQKNNMSLFDLAIQYKANCASYMIGDKTLLQLIIHAGNEQFLQKILNENKDISTTVLNAVDNDIVTINKLLSLNSDLLKQKFFGYTLLQTAIAVKNQALTEKILTTDPSSAEILTNNNETALKIAVRIGNENIISVVAQHTSIEKELSSLAQLVPEIREDLLRKHDIKTIIAFYKTQEENLVITETEQFDTGIQLFNIDNFATISSLIDSDEVEIGLTGQL